MSKNTSITLNAHFEEFIRKVIASGRYDSVSEVVRAGLRLVEKEEEKIEALRKAIQIGEDSGYLEHYDVEEHLKELNSRKRTK